MKVPVHKCSQIMYTSIVCTDIQYYPSVQNMIKTPKMSLWHYHKLSHISNFYSKIIVSNSNARRTCNAFKRENSNPCKAQFYIRMHSCTTLECKNCKTRWFLSKGPTIKYTHYLDSFWPPLLPVTNCHKSPNPAHKEHHKSLTPFKGLSINYVTQVLLI